MFLFSKISGNEYNLIARSEHYRNLVKNIDNSLYETIYTRRGVENGSWSLYPSKNGSILTYTHITHKILGNDHPQAMDRNRVKPFVMGYYLKQGQVPSLQDLKRLEEQVPDDLRRLFEEAQRNYKNHPFYENNPSVAKTVHLTGDYGDNAWDNALKKFRETGTLNEAIRIHPDSPDHIQSVWKNKTTLAPTEDTATSKKKETKKAHQKQSNRPWMIGGRIIALAGLIGLSLKLVGSSEKTKNTKMNSHEGPSGATHPSSNIKPTNHDIIQNEFSREEIQALERKHPREHRDRVARPVINPMGHQK